jgi:hypothetical protein
MSTSNAGQSTAGKTLGGLIVLLIVIVGFAGIGYSVGGVTGAIWVTLIGLVLYGLLYAWPSLTSGAEQTGMAKIVSAPFALVASIVLFIPAVIVGLFRRLKAQRDRKMGIEPTTMMSMKAVRNAASSTAAGRTRRRCRCSSSMRWWR